MVAVAIGIGEKYKKLAFHASQAIHKMTGLSTMFLDERYLASPGLSHPHHLKFRIFDFVDDESVLHFDADLVCLAPWNPHSFSKRDALIAVVDLPSLTIMRLCQTWGIPWHEYFNSSFIILNRKCHRDWFGEAETFALTNARFTQDDPSDDQTALNLTRCRLGLKLELLDRRFNWVGYGPDPFSYEVPVFVAHGLKPGHKFANIDFFQGRFKPPLRWHIQIDEYEISRLRNQTLHFGVVLDKKSLRLNGDGTIGPHFYPGTGCYWLAYTKSNRPTLAIASVKELLQEFVKTNHNAWTSVQELWLAEP